MVANVEIQSNYRGSKKEEPKKTDVADEQILEHRDVGRGVTVVCNTGEILLNHSK